MAASKGKKIEGFHELAAFVKSLRRPRRIVMLVKAGEVVDKTIAALRPLLEPGDLLVDGGLDVGGDERGAAERGPHQMNMDA